MLVVVERDDDVDLAVPAQRAAACTCSCVDQLNTYDVLVSDDVVFTQGAFDAFVAGPTTGKGAQGRRDRVRGTSEAALNEDHRPARHPARAGHLGEELRRSSTRTSTPSSCARTPTRPQIKIAVEQVFGVKVTGVNTINRQGKRTRTRTGFGKRADTKRAIVSLADGDRIDIFGGPVS